MAWQRVGSVADVQVDAPLAVTVGEKQLAVYRIGDDFYALDDVCPHAFALLSSGFVEGDKVECPLHQALFHIPTGKCRDRPPTPIWRPFQSRSRALTFWSTFSRQC